MALLGTWQHLLAGCDPAQVEAITSPDAPLLVVAAAGSGKTRVLTRRIAWRVANEDALARHVLALTFTRKAAGELRGRLATLGLPGPVTAGTFHAVALAQLRRHAIDRGRRPPTVLESKARLLGPLVEGAGGALRGDRRRAPGGGMGRHELISALATEIEWAKGRLVAPEAYPAASVAAGRGGPLGPEEVAERYAAYEQERRRRGLYDFDDLLRELLRALEEDGTLAAAQRWQFAHLFVDELQDATTLQLRLVDAWLGGRSDLFAVGDPRQSVYAFNGADPEAIAGFTRRHPGARILELETTYRSSPQIVGLAAAVLAPTGDHRSPRSGCPDGPLPELRGFADERAEAAGVVAFLRRAHRPGRTWSRCAVLARTNAQLDPIGEALATAGIPYRRAGSGALAEHPAVRAVLEDLPRDLDGARLGRLLAERADEATRAGVPIGGPPPRGTLDDALALRALAGLCDEYLALDPLPTVAGLRAFVRTGSPDGLEAPAQDAVELATFHRAKGLEWDAVCVTGIEDGFVPIAHARDEAALEEERRLLYVALTRTAQELHCSWAAERTFGSRRLRREPSPWLPALQSARRRLAQLPARATVEAALAAGRAALDPARDAAPKPLPLPER